MDILEGLFGRFRKKDPPPKPISQSLEGKFTPRVWTSEYFREYLMGLGRDRNFLLPLNQYPDLIELSPAWHEVLEEFSKNSNGLLGREHYSVVGFTALLRRISVLKKPLKGHFGQVPTEVIQQAHSAASREGIDRVVGDIHNHPGGNHLNFSMGDLYGIVYPSSDEFMRAIVGPEENIFAFKTRNSTTTGLSSDAFTQEGFCKFWYEQNGYKYLGSNKSGESAIPTRTNAPSLWELNLMVAKKHGLVIYEGSKAADLVKVFPISGTK